MAITINGQILRNLPEQVSKNTEDILELQDTTNLQGDKIAALEESIITDITLNNLEVTGNTVIGNAGSNTLTVTGASSFDGDVNITGDVTASGSLAAASATFTGNISASNYNAVENVLKGSQDEPSFYNTDFDITINDMSIGLNTTIKFPYAHARVSNGKLSICITAVLDALNVEAGNASFNNLGISIPSWVGAKLIPITSNYLNFERKTFLNSASQTGGFIQFLVKKASDTSLQLDAYALTSAITMSGKAFVRFEVNFSL